MGFLDNISEEPVKAGKYVRLQDGENRLRLLGGGDDGLLIFGKEGWTGGDDSKKVHRWDLKSEAPKLDFNDDPKVLMAVPVWNYQVEAIQIWNITQATIRTKIRELANDPEWGDPRNYDIKVKKEGEQMLTKYEVTPCKEKELTDEVKQKLTSTTIDTKALFDGGDPLPES